MLYSKDAWEFVPLNQVWDEIVEFYKVLLKSETPLETLYTSLSILIIENV